MIACLQDVLNAYYNSSHLTSEDSLMAVLSTSYKRLPSDAHRLMFVDAALHLQGRPPAHLMALWEGQLLLNEFQGDHMGQRLAARQRGEARAAWQKRQHIAAPARAAEMLADLQKLLLVRSETFIADYERPSSR